MELTITRRSLLRLRRLVVAAAPDYYNDELWKLLLKVAPAGIAGMLIISLNAFADSVFIGRWLGAASLAGVSLSLPLSTITTAIMGLLASGAASLFSRAVGAGDRALQRRLLVASVQSSLLAACLIGPVMYALAPWLIDGIGAAGEERTAALLFFRNALWGLAPTLCGMVLSACIRASGQMRAAMRLSMLSVVANLCLNPLFLRGLGWGIAGSALATAASMTIYCIANFWYVRRKYPDISLRRWLRPASLTLVRSIAQNGNAALLMQLSGFVRQLLMFRSITRYAGTEGTAFFGATFRLYSFCAVPVFGLLQSLQPVVGMNWGAQRRLRAARAVRVFRKAGILLLSGSALLSIVFARPLLSAMLPGSVFRAADLFRFRMMMSVMPCIAVASSTMIFFQATGLRAWAFRLSLGRELLLFLPLILLLPQAFGLNGFYLAIAVENVSYMLITYTLFHRHTSALI